MMITANNPAEWWEKARKKIVQPINWAEDHEGNDYCPIEEVIERINLIFGPFWDVKINSREFDERTSEAIVDATITFHTPEGMPDIVKDVIGRDDAVRPKYKDGEKVEKYEDRPIKSVGDPFAGARSNAIKRAAKDLEIALKMTFANPALNDQIPNKTKSNSNNSKNKSSKSKSGKKCSKCGKDISDKVYSYSNDKYGKPLCYNHQGGNK